jgi:hypothetical protein
MKLGWNLVTGLERFLSSWKSTDDPAQGAFSLRLDLHGYLQFVTMEGSKIKARVGSWNGIHLTGHGLKSIDPLLEYEFVLTEKEVYYGYKILKSSIFYRCVKPIRHCATIQMDGSDTELGAFLYIPGRSVR